jgi:alkylhydroperoxidase family enzyme
MSRLEQRLDAGDDKALQVAFDAAKEAGWVNAEGEPDNYATSLSSRPDLLHLSIDLVNKVLMNGELPSTVKAMVFYTIASRASCHYCAAFNHKALQMMGVPEDVIMSCAKDPELADLPLAQRRIVQFGVRAAKDPQGLTDADFAELRDQGLSDGEIAELIMMAGVASLLDIYCDAIAITPDH